MTKVTLSSPVEAHGETLKELTFRPPTGADVDACGYPFTMGGTEDSPVIAPVAGAITKMIVRLANVPASTVKALPLSDWNACAMVVLGFFGGASPK
jgi:hypothetical protein